MVLVWMFDLLTVFFQAKGMFLFSPFLVFLCFSWWFSMDFFFQGKGRDCFTFLLFLGGFLWRSMVFDVFWGVFLWFSMVFDVFWVIVLFFLLVVFYGFRCVCGDFAYVFFLVVFYGFFFMDCWVIFLVVLRVFFFSIWFSICFV